MLVNHPNVDPAQPIADVRGVAVPPLKEIVEARFAPIGFEEVLTELDIGIGIPSGFT